MSTADLHEWWLATELGDPEVTHVVTFRPVVRVRLALAPGADASEVIAAAATAWRAALASAEGPVAWSEELWQRPLADRGLVVRVEVPDAEVHVHAQEPRSAAAPPPGWGSGTSPPDDPPPAGYAGGEG